MAVVRLYQLTITLNVNGLNSSIKRHTVIECSLKKKDPWGGSRGEK
jgi:hypothetical protein